MWLNLFANVSLRMYSNVSCFNGGKTLGLNGSNVKDSANTGSVSGSGWVCGNTPLQWLGPYPF